jgi:DMSO reductase anchor subunit
MQGMFAGIGLLGAGLGGYFMVKLYRIPARPFWNHWHTGASFTGAAMSLGPLLLALVALLSGALTPELGQVLASVTGLGLALEGAGLLCHARDLKTQESEGAASFYEQTTTYGYPYWLRNGLLLAGLPLALGIGLLGGAGAPAFGLLALLALASAVIGRALFYVLVIPTTLPGAFFWRNKGFVEHAREVGLADMPQLGVAYEHHHPFRLGELLDTLRATSFKEMFAQMRRVITG